MSDHDHRLYLRRLALYNRRLRVSERAIAALSHASARLADSLSGRSAFDNDAQLKAALAVFAKLTYILDLLPDKPPQAPPPPPPTQIQLPERPPCPLCANKVHHWICDCPRKPQNLHDQARLMDSQCRWYLDLRQKLEGLPVQR